CTTSTTGRLCSTYTLFCSRPLRREPSATRADRRIVARRTRDYGAARIRQTGRERCAAAPISDWFGHALARGAGFGPTNMIERHLGYYLGSKLIAAIVNLV